MVCSIGTTANAVSGERDVEYLVVTEAQWTDIKSVLQERDIDCMYSEEENGVHIYDNFDQVEDILWAIMALDQVCAGIQEQEPAIYHGAIVP